MAKDYKRFFDERGSYLIPVESFKSNQKISVEELFQMFKARVAAEVTVKVQLPDGASTTAPLTEMGGL